MNAETLIHHLRKQPFQPFRVYLTDGSSYDIRHPENMLVTRRDVGIGLDPRNGELPDRMAICDPLHVERTEPIGTRRRKPRKQRP